MHENPYLVPRASGHSGSDRVDRGGSFDNDAANLRAANRDDDHPSNSDDDLGFRCASSRCARRTVSTDAAPVLEVDDQYPRSRAGRLGCRTKRSLGPGRLWAVGVALCLASGLGPAARAAPPKCKGIKEFYQGKCRYPADIEALKKKAARKAKSKPKPEPRPRRSGGEVTWVRIPGGSFQMGSSSGESDEQPVHSVTLSSFSLAKTETTVSQYAACVQAGECSAPTTGRGCNWGGSGRGSHPVNCVNWSQAAAFCRWAGGRLPTEAEWEYAARSRGRAQTYPWGDAKATCAYAVMDDGSGNGCGRNRTWPVCSKRSGNTAQGLCDMAGNVWEWVSDWYDKAYYGNSASSNPRGPGSGSVRVDRGGGFGNYAATLRAAYRYAYRPSFSGDVLGFRCAR